MQVDDGILSRRRWMSLGAIALVLVVGVGVLASTGAQDAPKPPHVPVEPPPTAAPPWRVGQTAIVRARTSAADASGPASRLGAVCVMQAGAEGTVVELGVSLSEPGPFVELQTDGCDGWVPASALRRP